MVRKTQQKRPASERRAAQNRSGSFLLDSVVNDGHAKRRRHADYRLHRRVRHLHRHSVALPRLRLAGFRRHSCGRARMARRNAAASSRRDLLRQKKVAGRVHRSWVANNLGCRSSAMRHDLRSCCKKTDGRGIRRDSAAEHYRSGHFRSKRSPDGRRRNRPIPAAAHCRSGCCRWDCWDDRLRIRRNRAAAD